MIREEFKNSNQKNLSNKELIGIKKLGERRYYSLQIDKLKTGMNSFDYLGGFFIVASICAIIVMVLQYTSKSVETGVEFYAILITTICMLVYSLLWYTVFKKLYKKKIQKYSDKIKEIVERETNRQAVAYQNIIKRGK